MTDRAVPEGWKQVSLGDIVADMADGGTPPRHVKAYFGGGIPWIVVDDVFPSIRPTINTLSEAGLNASSAKLWPAGSIILTTGASIGNVGIAEVPAATKQGITGIVSKSDKADTRFLYQLLQTWKPRLNRLAQGSTFREIRVPTLRKLSLLLPPLPEQRAIAAVLDSIDEAIERTEEVIAATEELRKGLLQDLLINGVPGWHKEWKHVPGIGTIPADWEVVRLGEVARVRSGTTPAKSRYDFWHNGTVPFIRTGQVNDVIITEGDQFVTATAVSEEATVVVPEGSVLVAMIGQGKTRGMTAKLEITAAINQNFAAIIPTEALFSDFFFVWSGLNYAKIRGIGHGSNQEALNTQLIGRVRIPLPSAQEQRLIADITQEIWNRIGKEAIVLNHLKDLKTATSAALLSGRVRVPKAKGVRS